MNMTHEWYVSKPDASLWPHVLYVQGGYACTLTRVEREILTECWGRKIDMELFVVLHTVLDLGIATSVIGSLR